jgi:hypothetical protein
MTNLEASTIHIDNPLRIDRLEEGWKACLEGPYRADV